MNAPATDFAASRASFVALVGFAVVVVFAALSFVALGVTGLYWAEQRRKRTGALALEGERRLALKIAHRRHRFLTGPELHLGLKMNLQDSWRTSRVQDRARELANHLSKKS